MQDRSNRDGSFKGSNPLAHANALTRRTVDEIFMQSSAGLDVSGYYSYEWLHRWASITPDSIFLAERSGDVWDKVTYRRANEIVGAFSQCMFLDSMPSNGRILLVSANSVSCGLVILASLETDLVPCVISPGHIGESGFLNGRFRQIIDDLLPSAVLIARSCRPTKVALSVLAKRGYSRCDEYTRQINRLGMLFEVFVDKKQKARREKPEIEKPISRKDRPARLILTSGSTGRPKAVEYTHSMLSIQQDMMASVWRFLRMHPPVLVDWLPWTHTSGGINSFNMALANGGTLYIDDGKPTDHEFKRSKQNLLEVGPTWYTNVPIGYRYLLPALEHDVNFRGRFFSRLDMVLYGGASLSQDLWLQLRRLAGEGGGPPFISCGWGSTETTSTVCVVHHEHAQYGEVGIPLPGLELKLVGRQPPYRAKVRGPTIAKSYVSGQSFPVDEDGYYDTGDLVQFVQEEEPEKGLLYVGRSAESFKLDNGQTVASTMVRNRVLALLDGIADHVLVAGPNRRALLAMVWLRANLNKEYIIPIIKRELASYNAEFSGSSLRIWAVIFPDRMPDPEFGEITEKGTLNQNRCFEGFASMIDAAYDMSINDQRVIIDQST